MDQTMDQEEYSYIPISATTAPGSTFVPVSDPGLDQYAPSPWTGAASTAPEPYYTQPTGGHVDLSLYERRGYSDGGFSLAFPSPLASSSGQFQFGTGGFDPTAWSPNTSSGLGTMDGTMDYLGSPMNTHSFPGSTSVSPTGFTTMSDWTAGIPSMDVSHLNALARAEHPPRDSYLSHMDNSPSYAARSFDTVRELPAVGEEPREVEVALQERPQAPKSKPPQRIRREVKANPSVKRKSSADHQGSSSSSSKKERKASTKPQPGRDSSSVAKLRTATRRQSSGTGHLQKPGESIEDQRARTSHNKVEKEYRTRLNHEFENVLSVLPPGEAGNKKLSKADVIEGAMSYLQTLKDQVAQLEKKHDAKMEGKKGKEKMGVVKDKKTSR